MVPVCGLEGFVSLAFLFVAISCESILLTGKIELGVLVEFSRNSVRYASGCMYDTTHCLLHLLETV